MDTLAHYVVYAMPHLWWPVALMGAFSLYRRPALSVSLITVGSAVSATVGTLHQLFGYSAAYDPEGRLLVETPGLLSFGAELVWSGIGLLSLVLGLVLLLWRSAAVERDG